MSRAILLWSPFKLTFSGTKRPRRRCWVTITRDVKKCRRPGPSSISSLSQLSNSIVIPLLLRSTMSLWNKRPGYPVVLGEVFGRYARRFALVSPHPHPQTSLFSVPHVDRGVVLSKGASSGNDTLRFDEAEGAVGSSSKLCCPSARRSWGITRRPAEIAIAIRFFITDPQQGRCVLNFKKYNLCGSTFSPNWRFFSISLRLAAASFWKSDQRLQASWGL